MKKYVKKMAMGGMGANGYDYSKDDDETERDDFSGVRKPGGGFGDVGSVSKEDTERDAREAASSGPLKQTFKQAFANAKDGSTFTWNGKKYKKEYAKPKAAAKKPAAAAKTEKPSLFRRIVAGLGNVKLPPSMSEKEEKKEPEKRPKPVSTAGAIAARNAGMKTGGTVKMKHGGMAHKKGRDGIAQRGKTKGRMV